MTEAETRRQGDWPHRHLLVSLSSCIPILIALLGREACYWNKESVDESALGALSDFGFSSVLGGAGFEPNKSPAAGFSAVGAADGLAGSAAGFADFSSDWPNPGGGAVGVVAAGEVVAGGVEFCCVVPCGAEP